MGLDIYFYVGDKEIDSKHLGITHNLNTLVDELGQLKGKPYYEVIWRPDELFNVKNGEVPISLIFPMLQSLIKDYMKVKMIYISIYHKTVGELWMIWKNSC